MTEVAAVLLDRRNVVGAVHRIIQAGNNRGGHWGERNRDPVSRPANIVIARLDTSSLFSGTSRTLAVMLGRCSIRR
jgi:hypothetical protein